MSFSQLPAVEKDTEKWAAGKFLGPSYFEATLVLLNSKFIFLEKSVENSFIYFKISQDFPLIHIRVKRDNTFMFSHKEIRA